MRRHCSCRWQCRWPFKGGFSMTLPLFPLNAVLFPGCVLDLQLFEARYLDMIGRCMKQGEGFGVVCITE
ncbi:hypothetical protein ALO69_05210, partial [Pseudomonas ficuserectae]